MSFILAKSNLCYGILLLNVISLSEIKIIFIEGFL
jgi:hypothetical protein